MKVCLDATCVIYLVEKNPLWAPKLVTRLAAARAAVDTLAVSDLARSETGTPPRWRIINGSFRVRPSRCCL